MDINCRQYNTQAKCYNYTTNCRWVGSSNGSCIRRDYVNAGLRYEGPVFQPQTVEEYIEVAELPPAQLINEVHFIDNSSDLFKTKYNEEEIKLFNLLIAGLNYTKYTKSDNKLFHFFYTKLMDLLKENLKVDGYIYKIVYVRFLQFMEIEITQKSCYTLEDIQIINADLPTAKILTSIYVFNKILKRCENTITNILIPVRITLSKGDVGHRNTLIVTPDKEVYLIEPNGINDNYITKLFENYFKETEYKFMGFYKYQLNYCVHGGFCNLFAILLYFLKSDKYYQYSELKEYIVKYFMWEYKNIVKQPYIENENSMYYILEYISKYGLKRTIDKGFALQGFALQEITDKLHTIRIYDDGKIKYILESIVFGDELKNNISELKNPSISYRINDFYYMMDSSNKINAGNKSSFGKVNELSIVNKEIKYLLN